MAASCAGRAGSGASTTTSGPMPMTSTASGCARRRSCPASTCRSARTTAGCIRSRSSRSGRN